ncbi:MAG: hypothetical protein CVU95_00300 [Firmicutes bacterium HGW-Firmicutes-2]|jgi:hypothetical protein|nr:MAG: hypothetical protein CVU95_00300 [Firmicutes bacterium HGW-Firmicutes-2]
MSSKKSGIVRRVKKTMKHFKRLKVTKKIFKILIKIMNIGLSGYEVYKKHFEKQIKKRKTSQI